MKKLFITILLLLLIAISGFAGEVEDIDTRISEIDSRLLIIPGEIDLIQTQINSKTVERDGLDPEDPQVIILQEEIDLLAGQRSTLQHEELDISGERTRLVERKRVVLIDNRLNSILDFRLAMGFAGLQQPNSALLKKEIIDNNDIAKLEQLEATAPQIQAYIQDKTIDEAIEKRFNCADKVKKKMFKINISKNLTKVQVKKFVKDFGDIISLVDTSSLDSAKEEIINVTADGVIVLESDKTELAATIDSCK